MELTTCREFQPIAQTAVAVFPGPVGLGPGARVILQNVITNCPFCGSNAEMEGEFRGTENAIQVIFRSSVITPDALRAFAEISPEGRLSKASNCRRDKAKSGRN